MVALLPRPRRNAATPFQQRRPPSSRQLTFLPPIRCHVVDPDLRLRRTCARAKLLTVNNQVGGGLSTILSISLPAALRARLDAAAKRLRRSRSFVVAEAIQEYLTRQEHRTFDEARERTLREGLALSPAERLRLSEELWEDLTRGRGPAKPWTAAFDTFDHYAQWRRERGGHAA